MSAPFLFEPDTGSAAESATAPTRGEDEVVARKGEALRSASRSLYRKYRPQTLRDDDLVGQEAIVRTLRNAIRLERVAHAYLFCGPRGTGKTTTARLLAKAVNCLDPVADHRPCNECANCSAIGSGTATDVVEIDAASNRGIDDIRELRERVKYAPTQLRVKFYIVDEAHQITGAAANAFLKTLEEPPTHTKFVLATTDPEELLPTIVSRCQRFDFRRIGLEAMTARLRTVATAEGLSVTDDALVTIARHATGSLRDALGLLDQLALYLERASDDSEEAQGDGTITADAVRAVLGVSRNDRVEALVEALALRDAGAALETVNAAVDAGEDPRQLNRQLVRYLRLLLHQRAGRSAEADDRTRTLAGRFELWELADLARRFGEIDYKLKHSAYAQLPLEVALIEGILRGNPTASGDRRALATQAMPDPSVRSGDGAPGRPAPASARVGIDGEGDVPSRPPTTALRDRVRGIGAAQGSNGAETGVPRPRSEAPGRRTVEPLADGRRGVASMSGETGTGLDVERLVDLWPRIRQDVKAVNRRIEALLSSIDPALVDGERITLAAAYEFHRDKLNTDEVRVVVEEAIARVVGRRVRVWCLLRGEAGLETPAVRGGDVSAGPPLVATVAPAPTQVSREIGPPHAVEESTNGEFNAGTEVIDADERRIQAAKNIFDAEEIDQDG